ncbi:hypothetical protein ACFLS1_02820 [Verrucomicrobiota bacterium]
MRLSQREYTLILTTVGAVLFGVSLLFVKPKIGEWTDLQDRQQLLQAQIGLNKNLVDGRDAVLKEMDGLSKMLPQYSASSKVDVYWLSTMDKLAAKHGVTILKRDAGNEKPMGDVYELPIEVRNWEADLDSIAHFLFELQSKGAMLDIRQLLMKPKGKGVLRGRFTLYCAYTRGL